MHSGIPGHDRICTEPGSGQPGAKHEGPAADRLLSERASTEQTEQDPGRHSASVAALSVRPYQQKALDWIRLGEVANLKVRILPQEPLKNFYFPILGAHGQAVGRLHRIGRGNGKTVITSKLDSVAIDSWIGKMRGIKASVDFDDIDSACKFFDHFNPLPFQKDQTEYDAGVRVPPIPGNRLHLSAVQLLEGWMSRKERKGKLRGVRKYGWQEMAMNVAR